MLREAADCPQRVRSLAMQGQKEVADVLVDGGKATRYTIAQPPNTNHIYFFRLRK